MYVICIYISVFISIHIYVSLYVLYISISLPPYLYYIYIHTHIYIHTLHWSFCCQYLILVSKCHTFHFGFCSFRWRQSGATNAEGRGVFVGQHPEKVGGSWGHSDIFRPVRYWAWIPKTKQIMIVSLGVLADPYPQIEGVMFGVKFGVRSSKPPGSRQSFAKRPKRKSLRRKLLTCYISSLGSSTLWGKFEPAKIWVFPKKNGTPQIIHFNRVFHYKPSILGYP